jgi:hypothetical protein
VTLANLPNLVDVAWLRPSMKVIKTLNDSPKGTALSCAGRCFEFLADVIRLND